jgi:tetratricopeptide (TPR) repeat protein
MSRQVQSLRFFANVPYVTSRPLVVRQVEQATLDEWAQSSYPMLVLEAIGGTGKSTLMWEWIQRVQHGYDKVLWWSFEGYGANFPQFMRFAVAFLSGDESALHETEGKVLRSRFFSVLEQGRFLLALDGIERLLVAYHRWDAVYMRDEDAETINEQRAIRAFIDPKDDDSFWGLSQVERSKILASSRLLPLALEGNSGVKRMTLSGLRANEALMLAEEMRLVVTHKATFERVVGRFGAHALLLRVLLGMISAKDGAHFDAWLANDGQSLDVLFLDEKTAQQHVLQHVFSRLDERELRFICQLSAFGEAAMLEAIAMFNPFMRQPPQTVPEPTREATADHEREYNIYWAEKQAYEKDYLGSDEHAQHLAQYQAFLDNLEACGLIFRREGTVDMHPLIRGYAFAQLEASNRKYATFERIREHFQAQIHLNTEEVKSLADVAPMLAIYRAFLGANRLDEAAMFFVRTLQPVLHGQLSAYYAVIELLLPLFPQGIQALPKIGNDARKSALVTCLASMYYHVGRSQEALDLHTLALKLDLQRQALSDVVIDLVNVANVWYVLNRADVSLRILQLARQLAEFTGDKDGISMVRSWLEDEPDRWTQVKVSPEKLPYEDDVRALMP